MAFRNRFYYLRKISVYLGIFVLGSITNFFLFWAMIYTAASDHEPSEGWDGAIVPCLLISIASYITMLSILRWKFFTCISKTILMSVLILLGIGIGVIAIIIVLDSLRSAIEMLKMILS